MTDIHRNISSNNLRHKTILVEGIDCSDCVLVIEHALERLPGVDAVSVNYRDRQVQLDFDPRTDQPEADLATLAEHGVPAGSSCLARYGWRRIAAC